jgi:phospholipid-binding lipoprotein MlaA
MRHPTFPATVLACALLLAGCATAPPSDPRDPFESFNRGVNGVNRDIDRAAIQPAARAYERNLPRLLRKGVSNVFANLGDPWSAVNSLLQLNIGDAAQNATRFAVNTVFGLGGLLDIATDAGIQRHKEDFGTTLGRWGVPPGPYMVLPLIGPSTVRDTFALPADWFGDPLRVVGTVLGRNALVAGRTIDMRGQALSLDPVLASALDPYTFMRDAYYQHRDFQAHGTRPHAGDATAAEPETSASVEAPDAPDASQ